MQRGRTTLSGPASWQRCHFCCIVWRCLYDLPLSQNALSQITKPKTPPSKTARCTRSTLLAMGGTESLVLMHAKDVDSLTWTRVSGACLERRPRDGVWKGRYLKLQAGPQECGGLLLARALERRSAERAAPANGRLVSLSGRAGRVKNFAGFGATLPDTSHTAMPKHAPANLPASATTSKILARKIRLKRKTS